MSALDYFRNGQRVRVNSCMRRPHGEIVELGGVPGRVTRLLTRDDSAWIELDERHSKDVHPFAPDDSRGTHVLAFPEQCEAL